jgi:hemerythrin
VSTLQWSEQYKVDVKEMDDQHRVLMDLVGQLEDATREGKGKQTVALILAKVIDYTKVHFAAEERLMKAYGYPEFQEHRLIHDKMTAEVLDIERQYKEGRTGMTQDVMQYLTDWYQKHITGTDKKYSPFVNTPLLN